MASCRQQRHFCRPPCAWPHPGRRPTPRKEAFLQAAVLRPVHSKQEAPRTRGISYFPIEATFPDTMVVAMVADEDVLGAPLLALGAEPWGTISFA